MDLEKAIEVAVGKLAIHIPGFQKIDYQNYNIIELFFKNIYDRIKPFSFFQVKTNRTF